MAADGPSGPGAGAANNGAIGGWNQSFAPDGSWLDFVKTANDPCPSGYRIPSKSEWDGVLFSNTQTRVGSDWNVYSTNYSTGIKLGNYLFLPAAGLRYYDDGTLYFRGYGGYCWSSAENGAFNAWYLYFDIDDANTSSYYRTGGLSVRCIAE
jgi:uncharacterized protein (TIGR02145 family)